MNGMPFWTKLSISQMIAKGLQIVAMVACHAIHDCFILGAVCSSIFVFNTPPHTPWLSYPQNQLQYLSSGDTSPQDGWRLLWLEREWETKLDIFANTDLIQLNLTVTIKACIDFWIWNNNYLILKQALFFLPHFMSAHSCSVILKW